MKPQQEEALFSRWLRRRRSALELTQKALARRVGCSPATIRKLEADERRPSPHVARELARALGVPEAEHEAFIRFARAGWADPPPSSAVPGSDRPWLDGGPGSAREAEPVLAPRSPQARPRAATQREEAAGAERPRIVAREAELRRLERELDEVLAGHGRAALIAGEAGQGKTALMRAFADRAQTAHPRLLVAVGTCNAYTGRGDPFLPFRQILAQLTGRVATGTHLDAFERTRAERLLRAAPENVRMLLRHGPHLFDSLLPAQPLRTRLQEAGVEVPPLPPPGAAGAPGDWQRSLDHDQQAVRAETADSLTAIADGAPLLLLIDDLHWIDASSAELLLHLTRSAADHPLLMLAAYRPADLPAQPLGQGAPHPSAELARTLSATVDLDRADGRSFVEAWIDSEANDLDESFRTALTRQTAGQPLFTIELLRAMAERGDLVKDDAGRWRAAPELRWDRMPARVADALAARFDRLSLIERDILRVASAEGETFTAEVVARALELDPRRVVRTLGAELDHTHHLVRPVDVTRGPESLLSSYRFRHNLIQRFAYDTVDPSERAYLHQSIAAALEALLGDDADPVALALHYDRAHAPARAAVHYRKAGDRAKAAHALDQAIDHYRSALAHWPDTAGRAELQCDLAECQWLRARYVEAEANLVAAQAIFLAANDTRSASSVQLTISRVLWERGDQVRAREACQRALALSEDDGDSLERARALSSMAQLHMLANEDDRASALAQQALEAATRLDAPDVRAHALDTLGVTLGNAGPEHRQEGLAMLAEAFRIADELGLAHEACRALHNRAGVLEGAGRIDEAASALRELAEYAQHRQVTLFHVAAVRIAWDLDWRRGRWKVALQGADAFRSLSDEAHPARGTAELQGPLGTLLIASAYLDLGLVERAHAMVDAVSPAFEGQDEEQFAAPYLLLKLRIAMARGHDAEATARAQEITSMAAAQESHAVELVPALLAALRWLSDHPADAGPDATEPGLRTLEALSHRFGSPKAEAATEEARAALVRASGDTEAVAARLTRAAELWQRAGSPLEEARARVAAARALRAAGQERKAEANRSRAASVLQDLANEIEPPELARSFAAVRQSMLERASASTDPR